MGVLASNETTWVPAEFGLDDFGDGWVPAVIPTPDGPSERIDPQSETSVEDGVVSVDISPFSASSDEHQGLDNTKYLMFTKQNFALPSDGEARFAVDMAVRHVGGNPDDYRSGAAAFILNDFESGTHMVFDILATSKRVHAVFERLAGPGVDPAFARATENPFLRADENYEDFHSYQTTLDRSARTVRFFVDALLVHEERHVEPFPESVHVGLGILTLRAISGGRSVSNAGQGLVARWKNVRYAL